MLRRCDICGKPMKSGYVIGGGLEYYCSDKCLHKIYTEEEWNDLYDEGNSDSYWTEWEDYGDYEKLEILLLELGFNISSRGFQYWLQAINIWKIKMYKNYNITDLYEEIAIKNNTTKSGVERALRICRQKSDKKIIERYKYYNKITNKSVLNLICLEV